MTLPLPALKDQADPRLPAALPDVIDMHVHVFPERIFEAIWRWFDTHGWPIRYKLHSDEVIRFLLDRGVSHLVLLHYAHKPGLARMMNDYVREVCGRFPGQVTGLATVMPGEPDAARILSDAFAAGLRGVKIHCHVQRIAPDASAMSEIYDACVAHDMPLLMHAGREPKSPGYKDDTHDLCGVARVEAVLRAYPKLRLCVPHIGADECVEYCALLERHENLWLDTTMMLGGYFPMAVPLDAVRARPDRFMFGTDFPNLPYAWDREIKALAQKAWPADVLQKVLAGTARTFFRL
jgi:predicted TIM-barrel fold metal-dependent hydrolase